MEDVKMEMPEDAKGLQAKDKEQVAHGFQFIPDAPYIVNLEDENE